MEINGDCKYGLELTFHPGRFRILSGQKICEVKMAKKSKKSKSGSVSPAATIKPQGKIMTARKTQQPS